MGAFLGFANRTLRAISQGRWSADEPATGLTWGRMMTGDSLWDLYQKYRRYKKSDNILEIGPGYGRLLKTALHREIPFRSYTALELSRARVERLRRKFYREDVRFIEGDVDTWSYESKFDVVICSSTFEHLYPDCRRALMNVHEHVNDSGTVFIDFIGNKRGKYFYFEPNGTYIRIYPKDELLRLFAECDFTVQAIEGCTLGDGSRGPVKRLLVVAKRA